MIAIVVITLLFFPAYALLLVIFPRRGDLDGIKRLALSFGLSIAVVFLIGLILNYTLWRIQLYPILVSTSLFIVVTPAIGWYRQHKLPETDRFHFAFSIHLPNRAGIVNSAKVLSVSTIIAILVAISCLGYVITMPKQDEKFAEFYILGPGGKAEEYPQGTIAGHEVHLIGGIVNHERQPTRYRVEAKLRGEIISQLTTGSIDHDQKWAQIINFTPQMPGGKQKVEFYLYKNNEAQPYFENPLHIYINVY